MKRVFHLSFIVLLCSVFACSKTDTDVIHYGYEYYPVEEGRFICYNVTEYTYDDFDQTKDTLIYQLKELIDSGYKNAEGRLSYLLKRYTRDNDTLPWLISDVWSITPGQDQLVRVEENISLISLDFPLSLGASWDGNSKNIFPAQTYVILNYDFNGDLGNGSRGEICRVNQKQNINLIEEEIEEVVYAKNIGPVFRKQKDVDLEVTGEIKSGFDRTMTLIEYGIQ